MCKGKAVWVGVYGTLKLGGPLCHREQVLYSRSGGHVKGKLYDLGAYPAIKLEGDDLVEIEVQLVPEEYFKWMVYAEGSMYRHRDIVTEEGTPVKIFEFLGDVTGVPELTIKEGSRAAVWEN